MANHRGIVSGWDTSTNRPKGVTTPAMLRTSLASIARAEGIMLEHNAASVRRENAKMALTLNAFTAVIQSPLGGWLCPRINKTTFTLQPGHSTYPRTDIIWVKQWDYQGAADHPDSEVEVGVTTGTPSASPQAPATPSGALTVVTVTVPKGAVVGTDIPEASIGRCRWTAPVDGTPVGVVSAFAGTTAPLGYLLCQGQTLRRNEYPELYSLIGTTYGRATSTTFKVPDLRTRIPVGRANTGTLTTLGSTGGEQTHTLTVDELPAHTHEIRELRTNRAWAQFKTNLNTGAAWDGLSWTGDQASLDRIQAIATGGGKEHNNMPPYMVMNYIIRAV